MIVPTSFSSTRLTYRAFDATTDVPFFQELYSDTETQFRAMISPLKPPNQAQYEKGPSNLASCLLQCVPLLLTAHRIKL